MWWLPGTILFGWITAGSILWLTELLPAYSHRAPTTHRPKAIWQPALWNYQRNTDDTSWLLNAGTEALVIALALLFFTQQGLQDAVIHFAFAALLILIAVIDIKYRLILNILTYPAILLLAVTALTSGGATLLYAGLGGAFAFFIFYGTATLRPGELGGGDVKLALLLGLGFGFPNILPVLIIGAGTAAGLAAILMFSGRADGKTRIPYAPFLCAGALILLLAGTPVMGV